MNLKVIGATYVFKCCLTVWLSTRNFNDLKTEIMDKEFKDAKEYYRQTRIVETRNWSLQMVLNFADEYHQAKLKLLGIADVSKCYTEKDMDNAYDKGFKDGNQLDLTQSLIEVL